MGKKEILYPFLQIKDSPALYAFSNYVKMYSALSSVGSQERDISFIYGNAGEG